MWTQCNCIWLEGMWTSLCFSLLAWQRTGGVPSEHSHHGAFLDHQTSQLHPIITNIEYVLYTEYNKSTVLLVTENLQWSTSGLKCLAQRQQCFLHKGDEEANLIKIHSDPCVSALHMVHIGKKIANVQAVISWGKPGEARQCYLVVN